MTTNKHVDELQTFVADISAFYVDPVWEDTSLEDLKRHIVNRVAEFATCLNQERERAADEARIDELENLPCAAVVVGAKRLDHTPYSVIQNRIAKLKSKLKGGE